MHIIKIYDNKEQEEALKLVYEEKTILSHILENNVINNINVSRMAIDDENNKWESIGTLKINSSFDKNIDLSSLSEGEVFEYIKNYFRKKLIRFFKTGIKSYCTSDKRLILNHKEVRE